MRVVSLACSNTEIVCALGLSHLLVGVDDHSDHPPGVVSRLPRVGPDLGIDVERVSALRPDLVLASLTVPGHERVVESLERAKLPFVAPEPTRLADVYRDILGIAELLGHRPRGEALVADMRLVLEAPAPQRARPPRVLVEWWPKPVIVPGRASWVSDLLRAVGALNPFEDRDEKSTPISDGEAVEASPDAVVISWCGVRTENYRPEIVRRRPAWQVTPALQSGRVFAVAEAHLGRPGPRLVEGYRELLAIADRCEPQSKGRFSASSI